MEKPKTGFWKTHPLLKAITVLVVFFLLLLVSFYCPRETPILGTIVYMFYFFYYLGGGLYILGGLYGIWLDRRCHFKFSFCCVVLFVLIINISVVFFFLFVYPGWKLNGYIVSADVRAATFFAYAQILSVASGFILSKVVSYISKKMKQER